MNRRTVRWLDRDIGRPIAFILTLHRRFCDILKIRGPSYKKPSRILFIKLIEQGSTVLAYSALKRAEDYVGRENIFFLVFKDNRPILDLLNVVPHSNVIEINPTSLATFIFTTIKAISRIRRERIDAVLDMEFFARISTILTYLSGARARVGLHLFKCEGPYRGDLLTHRLIYNPYLHTKTFFVTLVEALKYPPASRGNPLIFEVPNITEDVPAFSPTADERGDIVKKIKQISGTTVQKPILVLNPNISDLIPIRRWPEENFIKIGNTFLKEFPQGTVILTGNEREKENTGNLASQIKGAVSLAGKTTLRELLALYCIADILVTNDSGPAHFAVLTPIKSIILFGPETPALYGVRNGSREIIEPNLVCSPCVNVYNHRQSPCGIGRCMKAATAEDVYKKIRDFL